MEDLINWKYLCKLLTNNDNSIRRNKCPKKYAARVDELTKLLEAWSQQKKLYSKEEIIQIIDKS